MDKRNPKLMPDSPIFTNPYKDVETCRMTTDVAKSDWLFVKLIRPQGGSFVNTMNYLWQALIIALKEQGITDNTKQDEFEYFVSTISVNGRTDRPTSVGLPNGTPDSSGQPNGPRSDGPNDGRTTAPVRDQVTDNANVTSDLPSGGAKKPKRSTATKATSQGGKGVV